MNSRLLAFRVATPIEPTSDDLMEYTYDPRTQTAVWCGTGRASAAYLYCTNKGGKGGGKDCNAYGYYCTTWAGSGGYYCD
jgi:hypothetical protein